MKACAKASERVLVTASVALMLRTHGDGLIGRACRSAIVMTWGLECTVGAAKTVMGARNAIRIGVICMMIFGCRYTAEWYAEWNCFEEL
jgi:hypothetical protein